MFVVLHEVEGQAPHERQMPLAGVQILLRPAVRRRGRRLNCRKWRRRRLDEIEGPQVVRGQGEEGDELLGRNHFALEKVEQSVQGASPGRKVR